MNSSRPRNLNTSLMVRSLNFLIDTAAAPDPLCRPIEKVCHRGKYTGASEAHLVDHSSACSAQIRFFYPSGTAISSPICVLRALESNFSYHRQCYVARCRFRGPASRALFCTMTGVFKSGENHLQLFSTPISRPRWLITSKAKSYPAW
jgi:hypothetical protein